MAEFGWAYIEGGAITSSLGPTGSIQFKIGNQEISGSDRFTFLTASNTVHISGTLTVSGTISASNYVIDNVHVIDSSGSTTFGESNDDIHARTGSFIIASASGAPGSAGTAILSASISTVDGRSFVYASQLAVNKTPRLFIPSASIEWEGYASGSSLFLDSDLRVSGGVTLGDASTDVITIVGTATSSAESLYNNNIQIIDDKKLFFGTGRDASFEYDENGTDRLLYAGANLRISDDVKLEFGTGGDASFEYDENGTDTVLYTGASLRFTDDVKLEFGTGGSSSIEFNGNGDDYLIISGTTSGVAISGTNVVIDGAATFKGNTTLGNAATDVVTSTAQLTASEGATFSKVVRATSGLIVQGGVITGSGQLQAASVDVDGIVDGGGGISVGGTSVISSGRSLQNIVNVSADSLSGSEAIINGVMNVSGNITMGAAATNVTTMVSQFTGSEGASFSKNVTVLDDKKLFFGTNGDGYLEYNEDGDNAFIISGSKTTGLVLSGTNLVVATTAGMTVNDDVFILDDNKLYFGTNNDGYIEYNENGDNALIISGSQTTGLVLSGNVYDPNVVSGTAAGVNSLLAVTATGKIVLTGSTGGGGSGTPGGADTQIQYNNDGAFAGIAVFVWDDTDLKIADDTKLHFGTNTDGYIEYDEAGNNYINISGSAEGLAMSGTNVHVDAENFYLKNLTSNRPRLYIQNENADANAGQLIFHKTSSSPANNDVIGQVVFQSYDGGGNATIYGTLAGEIKTFAAGGERGRVKISVAELDGTLTEGLTVQGDASDGEISVTIANGTLHQPNGNIHIYDDRTIIFGNGSDATIEYNENGDDALIISGSKTTGLVLSGTNLIVDTTAGMQITGHVFIADDKKLTFGALPGDAFIEYDENGDDVMIISGSKTTGLVLSGTNLIVDTTAGMTITNDLFIGDDKKVIFGAMPGDGYIEYNENGDDALIISGSKTTGLVLSGTNVIVNSTAGMKLKAGSLQLADLGTAGATPASGFGGLYVNADKIYFIDDGGTSVQLGSAGAGTNNTWTGTNTFNDSLTAANELTASNGIDIEGGVIYKVAEKTANFTAASTDYMFLCNVTGAVITGTLPTAVGRAGQTYIFKDVSGSAAANNIVITGSVALQTIDGANEVKITSNSGSVSIMSNGTYWYIIGTS